MGPHEEATQPAVGDLVTQELLHGVMQGPAPPSPLAVPLPHLLCGTQSPSLASVSLYASGSEWPWTALSLHGSVMLGHRSPRSGQCGSEDPSPGPVSPAPLLTPSQLSVPLSEEVLSVKAKGQSLTCTVALTL